MKIIYDVVKKLFILIYYTVLNKFDLVIILLFI